MKNLLLAPLLVVALAAPAFAAEAPYMIAKPGRSGGAPTQGMDKSGQRGGAPDQGGMSRGGGTSGAPEAMGSMPAPKAKSAGKRSRVGRSHAKRSRVRHAGKRVRSAKRRMRKTAGKKH